MIEFDCNVASSYSEMVNSSLSILSEAESAINSGTSHSGYLGNGSCSSINRVSSLINELKSSIDSAISLYSDAVDGIGIDLLGLGQLNTDGNPVVTSPIDAIQFQFGAGANIRKLEGEELAQYCRDNNIGPDEYYGLASIRKYTSGIERTGTMSYESAKDLFGIELDVYVVSASINGVPMEFSYIYDKTKTDDEHRGFEDFTKTCIDTIKMIEPEVLLEISDLNPSLVKFNESEICDPYAQVQFIQKNSGNFKNIIQYTTGGYNIMNTNDDINLITLNYNPNWTEENFVGHTLHEFGHAYDSCNQYSFGDNFKWLGITEAEINTYIDNYDSMDPEDDIPFSELDEYDQDFCISEHFANSFKEYILDRDKFSFVCDDSSKAIGELIQNTKEMYSIN